MARSLERNSSASFTKDASNEIKLANRLFQQRETEREREKGKRKKETERR